MQLTPKEIMEIKNAAKENYNGNLTLAAAAHVHSAGVLARVGGSPAVWFDHEQIADVEKQVNSYKPRIRKSRKKTG